MDGGGSERQMLQLLEKLDRKKLEANLYLLYPTGPLLPLVPTDIPVISYWSKDVSNRAASWLSRLPGFEHRRQVHAFKELVQSLNANLVYDRLFHMTLITGRAIRNSQVAHVTTIVSPPSKDLPRCERRFLPLKRWLLARCYRHATSVLAVSEETARDAETYYGLPSESVRALPSPVHLERIDRLRKANEFPANWVPRTASHGEARSFRMVCVGRLSSEKGQDVLLDAFRIMLNEFESLAQWETTHGTIQLWFLGDGATRGELEQQSARLNLTSRVQFAGHLPNPYPVIAEADMVVIPSRYEGFPNVFLEALSCAVPVVSTACNAQVSEMMQRFELQPCPLPGDASALAHSIADEIRRVVNNPRQRIATLETASSWVRKSHSLETWTREMEAIFESAVAKQHRKG